MSRRLAVVIALGLAALGACDGGHSDTPDGRPDAMPPDAPPPDGAPAACQEMATTPRTPPVHETGDIVGGGADLIAPETCTVVDTPFELASGGVDRVVKLGGLVVGNEYGVTLASPADLAFYVVSGCSTQTGPSVDECALFVDAGIEGATEFGRFTATSATAWVVIDTWTSTPPDDGSYTLDVYAIGCHSDANCGGLTPACLDGRCVECADSFDCTAPQESVCEGAAHTCVAGDTGCTGDDAAEPNDDGPAGAPLLVPDGTGHATRMGAICDVPSYELDYVHFVVTQPGETWQFQLAWSGGADLDLYAFDADGTYLGLSYWEQPEQLRLTYLPPGDYYLMIDNYGGGGGPAVPYTLTAQRTIGAACTSAADCAAEYRNQIYRGDCVDGSCVAIAGDGALGAGAQCDSASDCATGLYCPSFYFVADADTRETCEHGCDVDDDCSDLGAGFVCTTYAFHNFCVNRCTDDEQCVTDPGSTPATPPWYRFTCDPTGHCLP